MAGLRGGKLVGEKGRGRREMRPAGFQKKDCLLERVREERGKGWGIHLNQLFPRLERQGPLLRARRKKIQFFTGSSR